MLYDVEQTTPKPPLPVLLGLWNPIIVGGTLSLVVLGRPSAPKGRGDARNKKNGQPPSIMVARSRLGASWGSVQCQAVLSETFQQRSSQIKTLSRSVVSYFAVIMCINAMYFRRPDVQIRPQTLPEMRPRTLKY